MLRRRARAQRALLGLVVVLVAASTAAVCATFGVVRAGGATVPAAARPAVVAGAGVPVALLTLAALVTFAQVARLLVQARSAETELLVSRGAAPAQVALAGTAEAAVAAVLGALVGGGAAVAALALAGLHTQAAVLGAAAGCVAVAAVVVLGGAAAAQAVATARRGVTDRSGRVRRVASGGLVVLTLVAAGVCLAQLLRYGSPLVTTSGGSHTDPLAAAAPALVLAVLAAVAAAVLGGSARAAERVVARSPGLAVLTVRAVGRRLVAAATPLVLLVLAGGAVALAGMHAGTAQRLADDAALLTAGADLRVTVATGPLIPGSPQPDVASVAALDGVRAAVPVLRLDAQAGDANPEVVAVPAGAVAGVVRTPEPADLRTLAAGVADGPAPFAAAPALPAGATGLDVVLTAAALPQQNGALGSLDVTGWLADPDGALHAVALGRFATPGVPSDGGPARPLLATPSTTTVHVPLGTTTTVGWRLAALDVAVAGGPAPVHLTLGVDSVTASGGGAPVDLGASWAVTAAGSGFAPGESARGLDLDLWPPDATSRVIRLAPRGLGTGAVPAVVARPLAQRLGVAPGDPLELSLQGVSVPARVAAVVDVVPGALRPDAVAVDLGRLAAAQLHAFTTLPTPGEVWAATAAPAAPALRDAAVRAAGPGAKAVTPGTVAGSRLDASGPVRTATWVAAAGTALLALAGTALAGVVSVRERRGEVVTLRAVGVGPRQQGRSRAAEVGAPAAVAVLVGLAGGAALGALVVPGLVRTTLTGVALVPPVRLAVAAPAAVLVVVLALGAAAVCLGVGLRVAGQARDRDYREEVR